MTLGETSGHSSVPKRQDEDLPWVLDGDRLENWSDLEMYELEVSFREWLFKAMENPAWKVPKGKGHWNKGSKQTFDNIRKHFNIEPNTSLMHKLRKLCLHYAINVMSSQSAIVIKGKKHSKTGYYFPQTPGKVKAPFCLRLKFEMMVEEGKAVTLDDIRLPKEKTAYEMNATRRLQNAKRAEYRKRHREKYGDKYDYGDKYKGRYTNNSVDEDTNS